MSDMLNDAITSGPVSLSEAVAMLDTAYVGHIIVLWSWAIKQPNPEAIESTTVRRSLDGRDREIAVPRLTFTEPITTLAGAPIVTTDTDIDFSSPPQVDQTARPPVQRRPRFDGDVSELPDRACWALQHLLTRRYLSAEADADVYSWLLEYRKELSVRLSDLDLLLRIVDGTDVAFVEQARYESARGIKLLRREPLGTYDSIRALHLAQMMRASGGQTVLISREEMHGLFSGVLNDTDRDAVTFAARIDGAIARLTGLEILRKSRDDEDSYTISPVTTAIMTASVITELQQQFEQLLTGGTPQDPEEDAEVD